MSVSGERSLRQMPWWLWPMVLCGIAPLAAWGWQGLFAQTSNVRLPPVAHQALALVVWIIAMADRLIEMRRRQSTWRHWFAGRYWVPLLVLMAIALTVVSWRLFWALPQVILEAGLFLVVPVVFYLFFARMEIGPRSALPRDMVRGALFSAGVLLPTCSIASVPPAALQLMIAQTLLVSLVFLATTCREHIDRPEEASHREDWEAIETRLGVWFFLLLGTMIWLGQVESASAMVDYYKTMGLVTVCMSVLHLMRRRLSADAHHCLSWIALCLPLLTGYLSSL